MSVSIFLYTWDVYHPSVTKYTLKHPLVYVCLGTEEGVYSMPKRKYTIFTCVVSSGAGPDAIHPSHLSMCPWNTRLLWWPKNRTAFLAFYVLYILRCIYLYTGIWHSSIISSTILVTSHLNLKLNLIIKTMITLPCVLNCFHKIIWKHDMVITYCYRSQVVTLQFFPDVIHASLDAHRTKTSKILRMRFLVWSFSHFHYKKKWSKS